MSFLPRAGMGEPPPWFAHRLRTGQGMERRPSEDFRGVRIVDDASRGLLTARLRLPLPLHSAQR
jgi:hypothetical protein